MISLGYNQLENSGAALNDLLRMVKMLKKIGLILYCFILGGMFIAAQQTSSTGFAQPTAGTLAAERLQLAVSSRDYPVTLGDIYRLTYRQTAGTMISMDVQVDGSGIVSLGVFGKMDTNGLVFFQLKQKVEELISRNYSHSLPDLSIVAPGVFRVTIRDGSSRIQYYAAWGLSRLSEVTSDYINSSISLRNVELVAAGGESRRFDLLRAALTAENGSDPLVKPGNIIILHPSEKTVLLVGEVRRPGRYELLESESLSDLIETFGGGLTSQADSTRVRLDRRLGAVDRTDYVSLPAAYEQKLELNDGDSVIVRGRNEKLPSVWFEGAVRYQEDSDASTLLNEESLSVGLTATVPDIERGRFKYSIREGQMLSDVLQDVRTSFIQLADLGSAICYTSNETGSGVPVDIEALLSGSDMSTDLPLSAGYRIVIPAVRNNVMVSGAVYIPGEVPFKPGATSAYYIILAGGADPSRNTLRSCIVYDQNGKRKRSSAAILPGDHIHVRENDLGYFLERRVPLVTSILTLVVSLVTFSVVTQ